MRIGIKISMAEVTLPSEDVALRGSGRGAARNPSGHGSVTTGVQIDARKAQRWPRQPARAAGLRRRDAFRRPAPVSVTSMRTEARECIGVTRLSEFRSVR